MTLWCATYDCQKRMDGDPGYRDADDWPICEACWQAAQRAAAEKEAAERKRAKKPDKPKKKRGRPPKMLGGEEATPVPEFVRDCVQQAVAEVPYDAERYEAAVADAMLANLAGYCAEHRESC